MSSLSAFVEQAFGNLTTKWRVLRALLRGSVARRTNILTASVLLHNFCINKGVHADPRRNEPLADPLRVIRRGSVHDNVGYAEEAVRVIFRDGLDHVVVELGGRRDANAPPVPRTPAQPTRQAGATRTRLTQQLYTAGYRFDRKVIEQRRKAQLDAGPSSFKAEGEQQGLEVRRGAGVVATTVAVEQQASSLW